MNSKELNIAVIDNYDSFTYNLVHLIEGCGARCVVMRNDRLDWAQLEICDGLVLGPGPGLPHEAGDLMRVIESLHLHKPILGICLGHQALGAFFGGQLVNLEKVYHGQQAFMRWLKPNLFGCPPKAMMEVGLYHSWSIIHTEASQWDITAISADQVIMALQHHHLPIVGLQFHPESVMTPGGKEMLKNWLDSVKGLVIQH